MTSANIIKKMVKVVRLKKNTRKIRYTIFSKWIYDDGGAEPGDEVIIETYDRKTIGIGVYDGIGAVAVRILDKTRIASISDIIKDNILKAYIYRKRLGWNSYRLVNSEGDKLPGLTIDVYKDTAVIQSGSIGIDKYLDYIAEILVREHIVENVYVRNDQRNRKEVGLEIWKDWIKGFGDVEKEIEEDSIKFIVNIEEGHKTGFFLDQRMNRIESKLYSMNMKVLDLFSYTGGFGIHSLVNNADKVVFVEKDPLAIEYLIKNIKVNNLENKRYEVIHGDAYKFFKSDTTKYGLVIVDPNALIQKREEIRSGIEKYRKLYSMAYNRLERGGIAFLSSCSYFLRTDKFLEIIYNLDPKPNFLGRVRGASIDHIYYTDTPELAYLKALFIRKP